MNIPIDRWIIGEGIADGCEYLIRTVPPRCIVRIEPEDADAALLAPLVVVNGADEGFAVAMWLDPEPDAETHRAILAEAIAANELFTQEALDDDA